MLTEVRMPKLGMSMKKGKVKRWLVPEGEEVRKGQPLYELLTDKVNAVIEAPESGLLGRIAAAPGVELPVGGLLALIGAAGDPYPPAAELAAVTAAPAAGAPASSAAAPAPAPAAAAGAEVSASPAARRLARELGVDLNLVPPAAPGRRLTTDDVEAFVAGGGGAPAAAAAPAGETIPFEGVRRVVAEHLTESLRTMAQVTISHEAVVSGLVARRERLLPGFEAAAGLRLTYTDLLIQEVAAALAGFRALNAQLDGDSIVLAEQVHMGVAVALEDGLIVPVIRDAGSKSLLEIVRERADLAARAAQGTLALDEIEGGTFTITNLGAFGADSFTPIVNPPQCAILGTGRIVEKPVAEAGQVVLRPAMWLSLTFDHRLVDGAPAARFLQALADRLA